MSSTTKHADGGRTLDSTFISIILTILAVGVLWGAYEIYRLRAETRLNYILGKLEAQMHNNRLEPQLPEPHLFDQEQA